ncbi:MAG TPA: NTP transferase domain-containing protein, partial [Terriglobales bacterium]|nr:NTP transferase domain-containing protein [Terriglobales bacterium]
LQDVLNRGRDAAIVTLVDRPPARPATLVRLRAAFEEAYSREKWAVVPEFGGKHGHPIFIGREMIHAFLSASPASTARDVEHQHVPRIEYVLVDDPFVTMNVDTPADYDSLLQQTK